MINHLRTLLLNVDGSNTPGANFPGEEIVPADYRAVALPSFLAALRGLLFGAAPDRLMLNFRLRQYLTLLHATPLVSHVLALDSRITYWPFTNADLLQTAFGETVAPLPGVANSLTVEGTPVAPDASGICQRQWQLTVLNNTTAQVQLLVPAGPTFVENYTVSGNLSSPVPLPGSSLNVQFTSGGTPSWLITSSVRPAQDVSAIANQLKTAGAENLAALFGEGTPVGSSEPFQTFRNLWQDHAELPYRLGGLLLAVAYRTDQVRLGGRIS